MLASVISWFSPLLFVLSQKTESTRVFLTWWTHVSMWPNRDLNRVPLTAGLMPVMIMPKLHGKRFFQTHQTLPFVPHWFHKQLTPHRCIIVITTDKHIVFITCILPSRCPLCRTHYTHTIPFSSCSKSFATIYSFCRLNQSAHNKHRRSKEVEVLSSEVHE